LNKTILSIWIIILFTTTILTPLGFGNNVENSFNNEIIENINYNIYHPSEKIMYKNNINNEYRINPVKYDDNIEFEELNENHTGIINSLDGPLMNSPWPMYCHDVRHTGRSPYSTEDNSFYDKWWFKTDIDNRGHIEGSGVIDNDNVIYFGSWGPFYAMYPNGTLKWVCDVGGWVESSPAIDENGTVYVGIAEQWGYLSAINPDGTLKWRYPVNEEIFSSPVIGSDGTIYFGDGAYYINALYPNGTLKWRYKTGLVVYSSPAIGNDGTVYCGSHDTYLYALYPDNGTLKWKYKLEDWIRTSPCIGDDGTIYVASLKLHALYPNGTVKWITDVGGSTSPTIGQDGTIYCGYRDLYALNPENGSINWIFDLGSDRSIQSGTPCNSVDGTIIFGTHIDPYYGGEIIAVNPDGTERWRKQICDEGWVDFAPIIGEDGTVYIGTSTKEFTGPGECISIGYLYAFNNIDLNAPTAPEINGPNKGKKEIEYQYTFKSVSPVDRDLYYYVEWGDGDWTTEWWIGPYSSGETIVLNHTWPERDVYMIRARCKDTENLWGPFSEYSVIITPRNKVSYSSLFMKFLKQFPLMERLLYPIK
jgi:outer membrane protein assembly factor BamB